MSDVSIQFTPGSLARLRRSAMARSRLLNEDTRKTLVKTSLKVLTALRASARVSKPKRNVVKNPHFKKPTSKRARQLHHIQKWYVEHGKAAPGDTADYFNRFAIERLTQNKGTRYLPIPLAGKISEAKQQAERDMPEKYLLNKPHGKRGLARASFTWMMGKLGAGGGAEHPEISGVSSVVKSQRTDGAGMVLAIRMQNKLGYIMKALQGGRRDVKTALDRARAMLMSDARRALKRMAERKAAA